MAKTKSKENRILNVRPDTLDFRDKMYEATLYEVPTAISLDEYKEWKVPILDQGQEGACTGFGLATVANYLLRRRKVVPDPKQVSSRMLYEMAKRYDEWPGEQYSGSSARGAMKGWHKHGVCGEECWPYTVKSAKQDRRLNEARTADALHRPLGAYYRVNHKDLVAMHSAMAEVGILYATATVHEGWNELDADGVIPLSDTVLGGHAFAIVAYDQRGFWIQNSWGPGWGSEGFALITYDDWLMNGTDVWVARLGAPVTLYKVQSTAISHSAAAGKSEAYSFADLRPHIISIGNEGELREGGDFGTSKDEVEAIFTDDFRRVTKSWKKKRLLLYAHGGLVSEKAAVQRLAEYRPALLEAEVYPVSFVWYSDAWTTITNVLQDAFRRRRPEGFLDDAKDFMLDRLDDALEPIARAVTGKLQWDEMKENARLATESKTGGARLALKYIAELAAEYKDDFEIHIIGHSAGSIFHAPLIELLTSQGKIKSGKLKGTSGFGLRVKTCTLWAPACTIELFKESYLPAIQNKQLEKFALFVLTDEAERDDNCANIYHKSLLYLVSAAFEEKQRIPLFRDGVPLLGMQRFINNDATLKKLFTGKNAELILAPNAYPEGSPQHSACRSHGGFDDDKATVNATLARMLNAATAEKDFFFFQSASSLKDRRQKLANSTMK
jgi:phage terminase Nu1 subunit (DNA packaging protein)